MEKEKSRNLKVCNYLYHKGGNKDMCWTLDFHLGVKRLIVKEIRTSNQNS